MCGNNEKIILARFEGKHEINGEKRKYWIEIATKEYFDEIVKCMHTQFLLDEPLCRYTGITDCKESVEAVKKIYPDFLDQQVGLLCFTNGPDGKPKIAGINVTILAKKDSPEYTPEGKKWTIVYEIVNYVTKLNNAFDKLKCDKYLSAMGLLVLPEFRGEGIGLELLKAREPLCRKVGLKYSCTVFTSIISQKLAERAGFKDLTNVTYEELFKIKPELYVPKIAEHSTNCKFMYIEYK